MTRIFTKEQVNNCLIYKDTNSDFKLTFNENEKLITIEKALPNSVNLSMFSELKQQFPELPFSINKGKVVILRDYATLMK